jgi:hypothetical protein
MSDFDYKHPDYAPIYAEACRASCVHPRAPRDPSIAQGALCRAPDNVRLRLVHHFGPAVESTRPMATFSLRQYWKLYVRTMGRKGDYKPEPPRAHAFPRSVHERRQNRIQAPRLSNRARRARQHPPAGPHDPADASEGTSNEALARFESLQVRHLERAAPVRLRLGYFLQHRDFRRGLLLDPLAAEAGRGMRSTKTRTAQCGRIFVTPSSAR